MKEYNKINLQNWCVGALAALTGLFTIIACTYVGKAGAWCLPLPLAGVGYGIYVFVKKYIKPLPTPEETLKKEAEEEQA